MEIIRGKHASILDTVALSQLISAYDSVHIDIGTGDGRYVIQVASAEPRKFVIGLDACRENLIAGSRRAPSNSLFVIANALELPSTLNGVVTSVTINFPWGSLLHGLLNADSGLLAGLWRLMRAGAEIDVCLNGGALAESGWSLPEGTRQVRGVLRDAGYLLPAVRGLNANDLRAFPSNWAKRLAYGRDPRATLLRSRRVAR